MTSRAPSAICRLAPKKPPTWAAVVNLLHSVRSVRRGNVGSPPVYLFPKNNQPSATSPKSRTNSHDKTAFEAGSTKSANCRNSASRTHHTTAPAKLSVQIPGISHPTEMDAMLEAGRKMRHGHRDATMILIAYRHGFR